MTKINIKDTFIVPQLGLWVDAIEGGSFHGDKKAIIAEESKIKVVGFSDEFGALCEVKEVPDSAGGTNAKTGTVCFISENIIAGVNSLRLHQESRKFRLNYEANRILGTESE